MLTSNHQTGYIALIALLIIAGAGLAIGLAVSISGIEEVKTSHSLSQAAKARSLASACIEDGLERLRNSFSNYSGSLSIDGNSCILEIVVAPNSAVVNATGTIELYSQAVQVTVDDNLEVLSWSQ